MKQDRVSEMSAKVEDVVQVGDSEFAREAGIVGFLGYCVKTGETTITAVFLVPGQQGPQIIRQPLHHGEYHVIGRQLMPFVQGQKPA